MADDGGRSTVVSWWRSNGKLTVICRITDGLTVNRNLDRNLSVLWVCVCVCVFLLYFFGGKMKPENFFVFYICPFCPCCVIIRYSLSLWNILRWMVEMCSPDLWQWVGLWGSHLLLYNWNITNISEYKHLDKFMKVANSIYLFLESQQYITE